VPVLAQRGHETVEVVDPLGEDQAVPSAGEGGRHVRDNLGGAGVVGDEVADLALTVRGFRRRDLQPGGGRAVGGAGEEIARRIAA
jgi:hypothetical protein